MSTVRGPAAAGAQAMAGHGTCMRVYVQGGTRTRNFSFTD